MNLLNNHIIGRSKPASLGSGKSVVSQFLFSCDVDLGFNVGVLPVLSSFAIVINENTNIRSIPDSKVVMGIIHPEPVTVDIPAKETTKRLAPSKRITLELPVILISRTKVLMNLAHTRAYYEKFWK